MSRILKGYDYFYNRKPSQWKVTDTMWLHKWMLMILPYLEASKEASDTFAEKLFGDTLTHK